MNRSLTGIYGKILGITAVISILFLCAACEKKPRRSQKTDTVQVGTNKTVEGDPLPGDLVMQTILEDSIHSAYKRALLQSMSGIIKGYGSRFKEEYISGYFLTDLNNDDIPELWIKSGNYHENSKLELFYPLADGSLKKSFTITQPGQYYQGSDYILQVVPDGPGYFKVNRIKIHNGELDSENIKVIDLYSNPDAEMPTFREPEIENIAFRNLTPLNNALKDPPSIEAEP